MTLLHKKPRWRRTSGLFVCLFLPLKINFVNIIKNPRRNGGYKNKSQNDGKTPNHIPMSANIPMRMLSYPYFLQNILEQTQLHAYL